MYHDGRLERIDNDSTYPEDLRLPSLLLTIVIRPNLARLVKNVSINRFYDVKLEVDYIRMIYEMAAEALGVTLLDIWERRKKVSIWQTWAKTMETFLLGDVSDLDRSNLWYGECMFLLHDLLTMLLALLPNLVHANLDTLFNPEPSALRCLGVTRLPLRAVTTGDECEMMEMADSLEKVTLTDPGPRRWVPSTAKTVQIHHRARTPGIEGYVWDCNDISSFSLQLSSMRPYCSGESIFSVEVGETIGLLTKFCKTLKSLYLDIRFRCHERSIETENPVRSLKEFTVLEDLLLCTHSVCPTTGATRNLPSDQALVDILSSSITRLSLVYPGGKTGEKVKSALLGLADHLKCNKEQFPNLTCIRCDPREICEGDNGAIGKAFRQVDVDLVYKEFPRYDWSYEMAPDGAQLPKLRCRTCNYDDDSE
ncbi:hypothetical protein ACHAPT_008177 [Fusarium lateritium]